MAITSEEAQELRTLIERGATAAGVMIPSGLAPALKKIVAEIERLKDIERAARAALPLIGDHVSHAMKSPHNLCPGCDLIQTLKR